MSQGTTTRSGERAGATRGEDGKVLTLPRPPRRRRRALISTVVVVLVLAGVLALLYLTPLLSVRTVSVTGTRLASETKLIKLLDPLKGTPLARVSTDQVKGLLASEPAIQDVRLGLDSPGGLVVEIVEHREVALLKQGDSFYLVGDNGAQLKKLAKRSDRKLPLVQLSVADPDRRIFETVVQALAQLPSGVLAKLDTAGAGSVDTVTFKLNDGRTVVWGDASQGAWKAADLEVLLSSSGPKDKTLDVSTPRRPVAK